MRAAFIPRIPGIDVEADRETALERLRPRHGEILRGAGFDPEMLATAEQVHGGEVVLVDSPGCPPGVDGLVTNRPGLVLGIYVADCAAVYLADRGGRAIALIHSGRAGTEANITGRTVEVMAAEFGIDPGGLVAAVSPCIRPPLYETDFAAQIVLQLREAGVGGIDDCGVCTGRNVDRYYSYRVEKGRTGRMLAVAALRV